MNYAMDIHFFRHRKKRIKERCENVLARRPEHKFFKSLNALGFAASLAKNSLRSNSFSYFVAQIACRNLRLNGDSKNLHSSKDLLVRNVFERTQ